MNILEIREGLNELPFRNGQRQVLIEKMSALLGPLDISDDDLGDETVVKQAAAIEQHLEEVSKELAKHDLVLVRGGEDLDELYAVQHLRRESAVDLSWMGEAMGWTSRVMAIALEMVLPVIGGMWLDARFGTRFLAPTGILIGLPLGLWHLTWLARGNRRDSDSNDATDWKVDDPGREVRMRREYAALLPGDRIVVVHHMKIGFREYESRTEGVVVSTDRRECGTEGGWRRNWDDRYWFDHVVLRKDDGELTTVTMDEYTEIIHLSDL